MNTVQRMKTAGLLTEKQAARVAARVREFEKAAAQDPEMAGEVQKKLAAFSGIDIGSTLKYMGATAATALGASVVSDLYTGAKDAIAKSRAYKSMMDDNPDLSKHDAKQVQRVFNSLYHANPHYARDPMVAGDFVSTTINTSGVDYNRLRGIVDPRRAQGSGGFGSILKSMADPTTVSRMMVQLPTQAQLEEEQLKSNRGHLANERAYLENQGLEAAQARMEEEHNQALHHQRDVNSQQLHYEGMRATAAQDQFLRHQQEIHERNLRNEDLRAKAEQMYWQRKLGRRRGPDEGM